MFKALARWILRKELKELETKIAYHRALGEQGQKTINKIIPPTKGIGDTRILEHMEEQWNIQQKFYPNK